MSGLDPRASQLLALGRQGADPSDAEVEALREALLARLGTGAGTDPSPQLVTSPVVTSPALSTAAAAKLLAGGAAALAVLGLAGLSWFSPAPSQSAQVAPPATVSSPPEIVRSAPAPRATPLRARAAEPAAPTSEPTLPEPAQKPKRNPPPARELRLEDEAALLAEVQGALRSGQPAAALAKLGEYERRFGAGVLRAEADAARVFAWCAAGQVERARAGAARFVQRYPSSPAKARVQGACAGKVR